MGSQACSVIDTDRVFPDGVCDTLAAVPAMIRTDADGAVFFLGPAHRLHLQCAVMHLDARTDVPDCGALWREITPDTNDQVVMLFVRWQRGGARRESPGRWAQLRSGPPTYYRYVYDFFAMTSTRYWQHPQTMGYLIGRERRLKLDIRVAL